MPIMHGLQHRHTRLYTSNLLGFRICRPHLVVSDASPVVSRSISSDCRAVPSSVGTSGGSIGGAGSLASHLLAALALYCFAGREWVDLALILR